MNETLFIQFVQKYFPQLVQRIVEQTNSSTNPLTYLHKQLLGREYSLSGQWSTMLSNNVHVKADIVSMDSSLPLKKRGSLQKVTGDIPKQGMKLSIREQALTNLQRMVKLGVPESQIVAKLFEDVAKVIIGVNESNEAIFLEALSTGQAEITDTENVGTSIRVDFGYLTGNKFGVSTLWSTPASSEAINDVQKVLDYAAAKGSIVTDVWMDETAFRGFINSTQVKELIAYAQGFVGGLGNIPTPNFQKAKDILESELRVRLNPLIRRKVMAEKNGIQTALTPWADGRIVFTCSPKVGNLVWADLAEKVSPLKHVTYQVADEHILVSKYGVNDPFAEFTSSQSLSLPVIGNVDQIFTLDTKTVQS